MIFAIPFTTRSVLQATVFGVQVIRNPANGDAQRLTPVFRQVLHRRPAAYENEITGLPSGVAAQDIFIGPLHFGGDLIQFRPHNIEQDRRQFTVGYAPLRLPQPPAGQRDAMLALMDLGCFAA